MSNNEEYYSRSINTAIRLGFIVLLLVWSFLIVKPFILLVLWGLIIAVAIYPMHKKLSSLIGGRNGLSAVLLTVFFLALLLVPSFLLVESTVHGIQSVVNVIENGKSLIPPPSQRVAEWKIIGKPIYEIWDLASKNIAGLIVKFSSQLKEVVPSLVSMATGLGKTIFLFAISIIIGGVLLNQDESAEKSANSIFNTLVGKQGENFVKLTVSTIRSVVQGVLGVAFIQAFFAGLGLWAIGMPVAGLWTLLIFLAAIMQLPTIIILGPLMVYSFSFASTTPAVIFTVWSILVGLSDNFLKPMLLGRGVDVPMLAILLGAIGGMMMSGIVGLFVGAVVLAVSYKVFVSIFVNDALEE
jgi:predicted PurR-regulated permease PerM